MNSGVYLNDPSADFAEGLLHSPFLWSKGAQWLIASEKGESE
jgi:hypothetical protein